MGPRRQPARSRTRRDRQPEPPPRARGVLVAAEVGLSLVLLVGAGLLLRTLYRLQATNPGFQPDHLLTVQLSLPKKRYGSPEALARFAEQATERLAELPGVADVSAASINPLTQWRANIAFTIEGRADIDREKAPSANYRAIAPGYFRTLRIPLLAGRDVDAHDGAASTPVALISQTLARRHFPDASPIGRRLEIDDRPWRTVEIVGVVGDVKHTGLDAEPTADVYVPYAQTPPDVSVWLANIFCVAVRTRGAPDLLIPAVQREIRALDRDVATSAARPMEDAFASSLAERRFHTRLLEIFGAAALALALAGIYALTAFGVVERTRRDRGPPLARLDPRPDPGPHRETGAGARVDRPRRRCGRGARARPADVGPPRRRRAANDLATLAAAAGLLALSPLPPPASCPLSARPASTRFTRYGRSEPPEASRTPRACSSRRFVRTTSAWIFSRHRCRSPSGASQ